MLDSNEDMEWEITLRQKKIFPAGWTWWDLSLTASRICMRMSIFSIKQRIATHQALILKRRWSGYWQYAFPIKTEVLIYGYATPFIETKVSASLSW
jgi:hypothetical protein